MQPDSVASVTQACLRRSISTAYYALFHHILAAAADRLVGQDLKGKNAAYSLIYRSLSHTRIADIFGKLDRDTLPANLRDQLGREAVSKPLRAAATLFQTLRGLRETADYEPAASFTLSDAKPAMSEAEFAIEQLERTDPAELLDVLALMLAGTRR